MSVLEASARKPSHVRAGQRWAISAARWATGIAKRPHFEAIGQRAQGRGVAGFPRLAKSDDADAKFHEVAGEFGSRGPGSQYGAIYQLSLFRRQTAR